MAESGGNPNAKFIESDGTLSGGLYQLSITDAELYGCPFKKGSDLFNPDLNTLCKDLIEASLKKQHPTEPWDIALARYWGTMRSHNNPYWKEYFIKYPKHNGYVNLQKYAKELGCVIK